MNNQIPSSNSQILLVNNEQLVGDVRQPFVLFGLQELLAVMNKKNFSQLIFYYVGEYQSAPCYTAGIATLNINIEWVNLRSLLHRLSGDQFQLASRAVQLHTYQQQHQFCGQCGQPNQFDQQESALSCSTCSLVVYPRVSPCMMCLIVRGEYCLLAHHARHPEGLYAALAGFVEAGESIEQTVHREVMEEVGLSVNNLQYFSSQSWPFPHQLMVGYFAEYTSGDIVVDKEEIADAQWFHYSELPEIPPVATLAGQLIDAFVKKHS